VNNILGSEAYSLILNCLGMQSEIDEAPSQGVLLKPATLKNSEGRAPRGPQKTSLFARDSGPRGARPSEKSFRQHARPAISIQRDYPTRRQCHWTEQPGFLQKCSLFPQQPRGKGIATCWARVPVSQPLRPLFQSPVGIAVTICRQFLISNHAIHQRLTTCTFS
jgi:hypothetical protein